MPKGHHLVPQLRLRPNERFAAGCIVTFSNGHAQHFTGVGKSTLRAAAEYADLHGLKIVTVSTPETIFRDLQGNREQDADHPRGEGRSRSTQLNLPEPKMLARIGRKDLLA